MNYNQYIASADWDAKRKARLEIDGHRCRLCDEDGSRYQLEVHHRPSSYEIIPNESIENDLITVCSRCHELITSSIREDRFGKRELEPTIIGTNIQIRQEIINHGMETSILSIDIFGPIDYAQRPDSRPAEQVDEIDQADFVQTQQNRRRL